MRSSIPTENFFLEGENVRIVAIPFKWGQVFQQFKIKKKRRVTYGVAIPFKWGQVFQPLVVADTGNTEYIASQSLLNEVKYSNMIVSYYLRRKNLGRNPF